MNIIKVVALGVAAVSIAGFLAGVTAKIKDKNPKSSTTSDIVSSVLMLPFYVADYVLNTTTFILKCLILGFMVTIPFCIMFKKFRIYVMCVTAAALISAILCGLFKTCYDIAFYGHKTYNNDYQGFGL
jgi:hypothetical protein